METRGRLTSTPSVLVVILSRIKRSHGPERLNLPDLDACSRAGTRAVTVQRPSILFALSVDECNDGVVLLFHPNSGD
jgi:hypothetical protein